MRTVTRSEIRTRIRQAADIEGDQHMTDTEINTLINTHYPKFWDLLVECAPPLYFSKTVSFVTVANQQNYAINTVCPAGDFYKLDNIYAVESDSRKRTVKMVQPVNIEHYKPVAGGGLTVQLNYTPCCPVLTSDADTIDGVNGWEEILVQQVAAAAKIKREEDPSINLQLAQQLEARIRKMSNRDSNEPQTVIRRRYNRYNGYYYDNQVDGYLVRGDNIELYTVNGWYW